MPLTPNPQKNPSSPVLLGVLGGLGPMASAYFYELLTRHTDALCDNDHIDLLLSSRASTPDRTAFILGTSKDDPTPIMCAEAQRLERAGATLLAIPCNTAHFFYQQISDAVHIPVINIIEETVKLLSEHGIQRVGVMATAGTIRSGAYRSVCKSNGIEYTAPEQADQEILDGLIYQQIKRGLVPDIDAFRQVSEHLLARGCERLVLGCTELSLIGKLLGHQSASDTSLFVDSLEVLAYRTILACQKRPVGFPDWFVQKL